MHLLLKVDYALLIVRASNIASRSTFNNYDVQLFKFPWERQRILLNGENVFNLRCLSFILTHVCCCN